MAEEFPCPHCGHKYPRSEKLVDRPVRCRECKDSFVLRADGSVDKVGSVRASQETDVSSLLRQATSQATAAAAAAVGGGQAPTGAGRGGAARPTPPSTDPDHFPCPHCGERYPRNDKLIDRPVRCRSCKDSFVLRADGRAEPVGTTRVERGDDSVGSVSSIDMPRPPELDPEPASPRAEFACPHCGVSFPLRDDLVGKRSRCTSCTGEFELAPDGRAWIPPDAEKVDAEAQLAKRRPPSTDDAPSSGRAPAQSSHESRRQKQEELRRQMSKRLQDSVKAAVNSTVVKRETRRLERESGKSDRKGTTRQVGKKSTKRTKRGSDDQIKTSAVLTGEGKRAGKRWLIAQIAVLAVALPAVLWFVFSLDFSAEREALEAFTAPADDPENWKWPRRTETMLSRAWIHDPRMPLIQDFDGASFHRYQTIDLAPLRELLAKYRVLPGTPLLVPADRVEGALEALADVGGDLDTIKTVLREEGYQVIDRGELIDLLPADTYDDRERAVLRRIVTGQTHRSGTNWVFRRFLEGEFPERIELAFFAGTGYRLQSATGEYDRHPVRYEGYLMRFVGGDWRPHLARDRDPADGWRVFAVQAVHPKDKLPGGDIW